MITSRWNLPLMSILPISDRGSQDYEEPDLAVYAAVDMSTLRDIRRTGMDYVLSMEALLHTTPGLKPGYLPEKDAHYLLDSVSVSPGMKGGGFLLLCVYLCFSEHGIYKISLFQALHMLTVSAYMEEKAAKYQMEALGCMRVALAGSPRNCFICLMCNYIGYKGEEPVASSTSAAPPAATPSQQPPGWKFVPTSLVPVDPSTFTDPPEFASGGEGPSSSGARGPKEQLLTLYQTCADGVKPSSDQK